ncbi:hypothetical protein SPETJ133_06950 [Staphylococcus petrasii]
MTITTIAKDKLITIFIPVRSRNMTLNMTKLIAKDTANIEIAKTNCIIIKKIIPNTMKRLEIIVIILSAFG